MEIEIIADHLPSQLEMGCIAEGIADFVLSSPGGETIHFSTDKSTLEKVHVDTVELYRLTAGSIAFTGGPRP